MMKTAINAAKIAKGWSNQKLAEEANLPVSTVNNVLSETSKTENPRMDTIVAMAKVLGLSIDEATGLKPPASPLATSSEAAAYYDAAKKYLILQVEHEREEKEKEREERKKAQREGTIYGVALAVVLAAVAIVLVIDLFNGNVGWFRG